jgi:hypothetical protein
VLVATSLAVPSSPAQADGDPASDVLAQQSLFLPQDAGFGVPRQLELSQFVREAARSGYPARVAVIASPADLGSVTALWNRPQLYARFLGQELALVHRAPVVVVMPSGVGVNLPGRPPAAAPPAAVADLRVTASDDLAMVAITAVQRLAAGAGVHLAAPVARSRSAPADAGPAPWIALGVGAILIAIAWAISLRVRPPVWRRSGARALEPPAAR